MYFDVTILTDRRYTSESQLTQYAQNVVVEDLLVKRALEDRG